MKTLYCVLPSKQKQRSSFVSKSIHCLFNFGSQQCSNQPGLSQAWLLSTCTMNLPTIFYYSISTNIYRCASCYFKAFQRVLVFITDPWRMLLLIVIPLGGHNLHICCTLSNSIMSWTFVEAFPYLVCLKTHSQGITFYQPFILKSSLM